MPSIIQQLKKHKLQGRGGAAFSTALKWEMVKKCDDSVKYVICNAAEGEPDVLKDGHILRNHFDRVLDGMMIAIKFLGAKKGIIYLNPVYYVELKDELFSQINDLPIEIFKKPHKAGYIGGEETAVINAIEGKKIEPHLRPPFPTTKGLYGHPTLVNNVETFYEVSLVKKNEYVNKRFSSVDGDCFWTGVSEFPLDASIKHILEETKNYPKFDFFVQVGGGMSGEVLNKMQLDRPVYGSGSITVYSIAKHTPIELLRRWIDFFANESCGQCTPCREGTHRLKKMLEKDEVDWDIFNELLDNLSDTSFCSLGLSVPIPVKTYVNNVLRVYDYSALNVDKKFVEKIISKIK